MRDKGHTPVPNRGRAGLCLLLLSFPTSVPSSLRRLQSHLLWAAPKKPSSLLRQGNGGSWLLGDLSRACELTLNSPLDYATDDRDLKQKARDA